MNRALYILLLGFLISCAKDDKVKLIGEWYRLDKWINTGDSSNIEKEFYTFRPPGYYPFGYEFLQNDSVEYLPGIWEKTGNKSRYLGQYRHYKVKGDSLIMHDSKNLPYSVYKIIFLNKDTVQFCNTDTCLTYVRFTSMIKNYIKIDSIKINHRDGWGKNIEYKVTSTCEISYINNSHQYEESLKISKRGIISQKVFKDLELKYNKADFINLTDYFGCCDGDLYTIDIYYNGHDKKRINDYMNSSPMKFIWANRFLMTKIENLLRI